VKHAGASSAAAGTLAAELNASRADSAAVFAADLLDLDALPLHEPILVGTFAVVATGGLALFALVT
jgi:hypothetical protein